jgi:hypothetical protein
MDSRADAKRARACTSCGRPPTVVCPARQSGFLDSYPFDPAGLYSQTNQTKELKNGRLAVRTPAHARQWLPPMPHSHRNSSCALHRGSRASVLSLLSSPNRRIQGAALVPHHRGSCSRRAGGRGGR